MIGRLWIWVVVLLVVRTASASESATRPAMSLPGPGDLDEAAFRDALRARGLTLWLQQYAADSRPADDLDAALRQRESLLTRLDDGRLPLLDRGRIVAQAGGLLDALIQRHPAHPLSLWWRFEHARDYLDRADPAAVHAVLYYDLAGRDRAAVAELSAKAVDVLRPLRSCVAGAWSRAEELDEAGLAAMETSGWLRSLEALDYRSTVLLAWARLQNAITADLPLDRRAALLDQLLAEITQRYGWTSGDKYDPTQRANALVMAAVAARWAGRLADAGEYARQVVAIQSEISDVARRKELRDEVLLAVIEQVRVLRDAGKRDEALKAVDTARQWVRKSRPDELAALLAVDLAERRILAGTNDGGFLSRREALVPLEVFASESISRTDYLYAAIAGALADEPIGPDLPPFALQLIVGATVSDAQHRIPPEGRANDARLRAVIDVLQCGPASKPADVPAARAGELIWLKGRALYLADRKLDAADAFADLVEAWPKHARAEPAMNIAVAIVQNAKELQALSPAAVASRAAFIRVGRLFRKFRPDSAESKRLQYFIARALEDEDRLREAADEYAAVPFDDVNAAHAMLRRVRCLRSLLDSALADERVNQEHKSAIIDETVRAAREGVRAAATRAAGTGESDACLGAEQALVLAGLLNLPVVGRPTDALAALDGFEQHFARCSPAVGQALRERIVALRQLKRLGEARLVVEQYLKTDPEQAGPVMVRLLEAMHAEIGSAAERDDPSTVREIADEAANLARSLLDWSAAREGTISARDRLTIAIWRAAAVLHAGRAEEALGLYDACDEAAGRLGEEHKSQDVEIRLGQAESLLAIGKPADALSLFATLGRVLSEESPAWWRAFAGQLQCHSALEHDPVEILRAIDQRRYFARDLGGVRIRRVLDAIEKTNRSRLPLSAPGP